MKGRLLTIEEIEQLKQTDEKFILKRINDEIIVKVGKHSYVDVFNNWVAFFKCVGLMDGTFKIYEYIEEPKTYTTLEAIEELMINEKKKFVTKNCVGGESILFREKENNQYVIKWETNDGVPFRLTEIILKYSWTLIEEPKEVTFIEDIKEFDKGKTIKCITKYEKLQYTDESIYKCSQDGLVDTTGHYPTPTDVLNGKWYVED